MCRPSHSSYVAILRLSTNDALEPAGSLIIQRPDAQIRWQFFFSEDKLSRVANNIESCRRSTFLPKFSAVSNLFLSLNEKFYTYMVATFNMQTCGHQEKKEEWKRWICLMTNKTHFLRPLIIIYSSILLPNEAHQQGNNTSLRMLRSFYSLKYLQRHSRTFAYQLFCVEHA